MILFISKVAGGWGGGGGGRQPPHDGFACICQGCQNSSRGPCPANKLLHTYPPPYIFFIFHLLPLFVFIIFLHSFLSISSVFLSSFFQNFRHPFLLPPRLIHFTNYPPKYHFLNLLASSISKNKFCKIYWKKYLSSKKYSNCLKTICPFPGQKIEQQQHHSPPSFHHFYHICFWGVVSLVGFYLQYIKRYTDIIIITYKGINVIIIV